MTGRPVNILGTGDSAICISNDDADVIYKETRTALAVLAIPGPGVLDGVARSIAQGSFAAFVAVLGRSAGVLVHGAASAVGLSAILLTSSAAFSLIKFIGAGLSNLSRHPDVPVEHKA